ncbi:MAG: PDZ domain-containing protein, partial [Planctomycetota bacterium]
AKWDQKSISSFAQISQLLRSSVAGELIRLDVNRNGQFMAFEVRLDGQTKPDSENDPKNEPRLGKPTFGDVPPNGPSVNGSPPNRFSKTDQPLSELKKSMMPLVNHFQPSIVKLTSQGDRESLGTIVSWDGLVVGKLSEVSLQCQCRFNHHVCNATLVASDSKLDLALLQIPNRFLQLANLRPVIFPRRPLPIHAGRIVVSPTSAAAMAKFGMVSVTPQEISKPQPKCNNAADYGLELHPFRTHQVPNRAGNLTDIRCFQVSGVSPGSACEKCGLRVGDLLFSLNGKLVDNQAELDQVLKALRLGQTLEIVVVRKQKWQKLTAIIRSLAPKIEEDRWGGGPFSEIRFEFGSVIIHDTGLNPTHCGGPLVSLEGELLGFNISRSLRVASFALAADSVKQFVKSSRPNANIPHSQMGQDSPDNPW